MLLVKHFLSLYLHRQWLTRLLAAACGLLALDFAMGPLGVRDLSAAAGTAHPARNHPQKLLKSNAALKLD